MAIKKPKLEKKIILTESTVHYTGYWKHFINIGSNCKCFHSMLDTDPIFFITKNNNNYYSMESKGPLNFHPQGLASLPATESTMKELGWGHENVYCEEGHGQEPQKEWPMGTIMGLKGMFEETCHCHEWSTLPKVKNKMEIWEVPI